jgi:hypothetical protein
VAPSHPSFALFNTAMSNDRPACRDPISIVISIFVLIE